MQESTTEQLANYWKHWTAIRSPADWKEPKSQKNTEIAVLRQEIADLNQKLQKCQQEATPIKWSNIDNEMKDIHFET